MNEKPWTEQAIDEFFAARRSPTRSQCDQLALSISSASVVHSVDVPGSLSYTVVYTKTQGREQQHGEAIVVSFRQSESELDEGVVELALEIHGCLGQPWIPMKKKSMYFARCWTTPRPVEPRTCAESQAGISRAALKASLSAVVPISTLYELETTLPLLFTGGYPQVLTHGDLTKTNALVNPDTYEVTGLVDWSLAAVQPFGIELDCLFLMTGCMDLSGWHDYACRSCLVKAFWTEF